MAKFEAQRVQQKAQDEEVHAANTRDQHLSRRWWGVGQ